MGNGLSITEKVSSETYTIVPKRNAAVWVSRLGMWSKIQATMRDFIRADDRKDHVFCNAQAESDRSSGEGLHSVPDGSEWGK